MTSRISRGARAALALALALLIAAPFVTPDAAAKETGPPGEFAPGIPYLTDYDVAIKRARESGRILLVYNGWEKEKI